VSLEPDHWNRVEKESVKRPHGWGKEAISCRGNKHVANGEQRIKKGELGRKEW